MTHAGEYFQGQGVDGHLLQDSRSRPLPAVDSHQRLQHLQKEFSDWMIQDGHVTGISTSTITDKSDYWHPPDNGGQSGCWMVQEADQSTFPNQLFTRGLLYNSIPKTLIRTFPASKQTLQIETLPRNHSKLDMLNLDQTARSTLRLIGDHTHNHSGAAFDTDRKHDVSCLFEIDSDVVIPLFSGDSDEVRQVCRDDVCTRACAAEVCSLDGDENGNL